MYLSMQHNIVIVILNKHTLMYVHVLCFVLFKIKYAYKRYKEGNTYKETLVNYKVSGIVNLQLKRWQ